MTQTFTPGPWTIGAAPENDDEGCESIWYDLKGGGAEIAGRICEHANARLIAAAPALYAALEGIRDYATSIGVDYPARSQIALFMANVEAQARAALAQADRE